MGTYDVRRDAAELRRLGNGLKRLGADRHADRANSECYNRQIKNGGVGEVILGRQDAEQHGPGPVTGVQGEPSGRQLAACAGIGATMLVTNAAAPKPNRAPISRRLLAALMSGGNAMASVSSCAFVS
jgi:hypothetical protein